MKTLDELMAMIPAEAFRQDGRFESKLTFDGRCEVLAFHRMGIARTTLAQAFNIDRRTVTHMYTSTSPHYRSIRQEEEKLGREEFCKKYITEEGTKKVAAARGGIGQVDPNAPKKASSRFAGLTMVKTENTNHAHRIMIEWQNEGHEGAGWYYRDLDSDNSNDWFHNGPESIRTSQECLKAVKENLFDM